MRVRLVVPADVDQPTGGNVYDLALAEALQQGGDRVDVVRCLPADLADALSGARGVAVLVDGLLALDQPRVVAAAGVGLLVHTPEPVPDAGRVGPGGGPAGEKAWHRVLESASPVVVTSRWSAGVLARRHGLPDVVVAPPGATPAALVSGSEPALLVQLAAVLPHKDQLGVVAALARLADLRWRARLAGSLDRDPGYADAVRAAVRDAGLEDRVEMPGVVSRTTAWAGADLALLPSRVESFGMVVTEALARGVPAVVSEGGPEEALGLTPQGEPPGAVVRPGDPDGLARVLRRWLTDAPYRDLLRARALTRRETLEGWDITALRVRQALLGAGGGSATSG
jgi:glycosyltransferase involved in cell wall biosynthesis